MNEFKPLDVDRVYSEIQAERARQAEGIVESNQAAEPVTAADIEAHNRARRCMGLPEQSETDARAAIMASRESVDAYANAHPHAWAQVQRNAERARQYGELRRRLDNT